MAGRGPIVVGSIEEAINQSNEFPGALGWMLAPLATRGGGKRSWHVLRVQSDKDGDRAVGWCRENDEGGKLPTLDLEADDLPELPASKISLWELVFIDGNSDLLGPRIWIDPSQAAAQPKAEPAQQSHPAAPQEAKAPRSEPMPGNMQDVLLKAFELQIGASKAAQDQSLAAMKAVTSSIAEIGKGYAEVQTLLTEEIKRSRDRVAVAEALRDEAVTANLGLSGQLAEAREDSQLHLTIRELFKDKPELLVTSAAELLDGILKRLSGAPSQ